MENNTKSNNGKKVVIVVIIAILLAANGVLLWEFFTQKETITNVTNEKNVVVVERDELKAKKAELQAQFDSLVSLNSELTGKLKISDDSLAVLQAKINSLMYVQSQLGTVKAQMEKLKSEMAAKIEEMTSLQKENDALKSDKTALTNSLNDSKTNEQKLTKDKEALASKVALGSLMKADNFIISGAKFNKNGKESTTTSAKSTQKIKICFTVEDNLVVDKGTKTLFIRIMDPDNKCATNNSQTFQSGSQSMTYSTSQDINYNNQKLDQCVYFAKNGTFKPGKYHAEVYIDGNLAGTSSSIILK